MLLPCPFCGGEPRIIDVRDKDGFIETLKLQCQTDGCWAEITAYSATGEPLAYLEKAWNRRTHGVV